MSRIYFLNNHKKLLRNIIFELTTKKISNGNVSLIKKNKHYKEELINNTQIPTELINIIYSYTQDIFDLSITCRISSAYEYSGIHLYIKVKLDNMFVFIFSLGLLCCKIHIETIYGDIWYDASYVSEYNDIKNDTIKMCKTMTTFGWLEEDVEEFNTFEYYYENYIYLIYSMMLNSVFNSYMRKYYNKEKYLLNNEIENCNYVDGVFINQTLVHNGYIKYTIIHPKNNKKLKNIIVMCKVISNQLKKIIKEIHNDEAIIDSFMKSYITD